MQKDKHFISHHSLALFLVFILTSILINACIPNGTRGTAPIDITPTVELRDGNSDEYQADGNRSDITPTVVLGDSNSDEYQVDDNRSDITPTVVLEDSNSDEYQADDNRSDITGFGVLGDSNSDEYQADDNRGGQFADQTYNWVELLVQNRHLNFGKWSTWDDTRREGYEYNWSRSGATIRNLITSGLLDGLAEQVVNGKISHIFIWIGWNDFNLVNGTYRDIYDGTLDDTALERKVTYIIDDMNKIFDTITAAGDVDIIVVSFADPGISPLVAQEYPDKIKRNRVSTAIKTINENLAAIAKQHNAYVVDIDTFSKQFISMLDAQGNFKIDGQQINAVDEGNDPHYLRLGDHSGHPGTVLSGIMANELFIKPFNQHFQTGIEFLTDTEILSSAGISR